MADDVLFREELDEKYFKSIEATIKEIKSYANSNFEYYKCYSDNLSLRFVQSCSFLLDYINDGLLEEIGFILTVGRSHDFSENCPGNGFRSLVKVIHRCCYRVLSLVRYISNKKSSVFFRHDTHGKELEAFVNTLGQLKACLHYAQKYCYIFKENLIVEDCNDEVYNLMLEFENLSQEPFFGTCLGFQFCESMSQPLNMMHLILACYNEGFNKPTALMKVTSSLLHSGKFYLSPELRSQKVVSATLDGDVTFCKSFWSLSENMLVHNIAKIVSPTVALETTFNIPTDPVQACLQLDPSTTITIHPSSSYGDPLPIPVRLISYNKRQGQQVKSSNVKPPSQSLIIHCHGGGFVAQSSLSHAGYLRHWAKDLDVPIISIDYSLAPEYAYPRQVEDIFFAYCWILNNLAVLGTTGKSIVFVGDSAGANLVLSTAFRCCQMGVRKPDGVLCVYGCFLVRYSPTPSRLLSLSDPILPTGNLSNCLTAYIGIDIRLKEDFYKKKKLQKQQELQILNEQRDLENSNKPEETDDFLLNQNNEERKQGKRTFAKLFKLTSLEFLRKHPLTFKRTCKSCEFEDLTLDAYSSKKPALHQQISLGNVPLKKTKLRSANSEEALHEYEENSNGKNEKKLIENSTENDKIPFVDEYKNESETNLNITKTDDNKNSKVLQMLVEPCPSQPPELEPEPTEEEKELLEDAEKMIEMLKDTVYPYGAIVGKRKILLNKKALKKQLAKTKDIYLSPVFAPDEILKQINCISFVGLHIDPLLDESVFMAKRFKALGSRVTLDLVDDLPHGFLNFMHMSKEAYQATTLCGLRLKRLLVAGNRMRLESESSVSSEQSFYNAAETSSPNRLMQTPTKESIEDSSIKKKPEDNDNNNSFAEYNNISIPESQSITSNDEIVSTPVD